MGKDTKLVHFMIVDGNEEQIATLATAVNTLKDKLPYEIEFLVTNDRIRLYDVKYLIDELYKIYKLEKKLTGDVKGDVPIKTAVKRDAAASASLDKKPKGEQKMD